MSNTKELMELWQKACEGDQKAYAELHKNLYPGLFTYSVKILKDTELADDLLQDLFIKFWQNRIKIGSIAYVKAYFYRSARSIIINYLRSHKILETRKSKMPVPEMEFSQEEVILFTESDAKLKEQLANALNKLPARQREMIYMRFYENMDYMQITDICGIKYQSIVNHIHRGVQTLRKEMSEDLFA